MRQFGLIGFPLTHSFSKKYFEQKFLREGISDSSYELFPIDTIEELPLLLGQNPNLCGLNVTIPYKELVMDYLDEITAEAEEIGAVNCICIQDQKLIGHNTDVYGFEKSLLELLTEKSNTDFQAFVLGSGGSSKAVKYVLEKMRIPFQMVSREAKESAIHYKDIPALLGERNLFINTTPLGMLPDIETYPDIPYTHLTGDDVLFDLVYNPEETLFLKKGKEKGAKVCNGRQMLELQAEKSWEIWNQR